MVGLQSRSIAWSRRELLKYSTLGGISMAMRGALGAARQPIVRTPAGSLQGYATTGVNIFKGIPYGATTEGEHRFLPPREVAPWAGVRDASRVGPMAVQRPLTDPTYAKVLRGLFPQPLYGAPSPLYEMSEDCLYLNVWTPEVGKGTNRPVMVWLHPGAFNGWAGYSEWTDGTNLAGKRDVVVVSLNHRLNLFGHLYLGDVGGPKYAESGNAGMLDIVAALRWVQENISAFGGDPDNVTIFGESGGACKVSVLMAMPSAKGLFHKAIVQSNSWNKTMRRDEAVKSTEEVMRRLNISPRAFRELHQVPAEKILSAWVNTIHYPVVAGNSLPRQPFDPDAPEVSANVPMLIGTNKNDFSYLLLKDSPPELSNPETVEHALVDSIWRYGLDADEAGLAVKAFRGNHPNESWRNTFIGTSTAILRDDATIQAERKAAQGRAAAYMYQFTWASPAFEGKYGSMHTFEIPFAFDNVDAAGQLFGADGGTRRYELATNVSKAWAAFAHTGNPSHPELPHWKPYSTADRATMLLNDSCELVNDPDREDRVAFGQLRPERTSKIRFWRPS